MQARVHEGDGLHPGALIKVPASTEAAYKRKVRQKQQGEAFNLAQLGFLENNRHAIPAKLRKYNDKLDALTETESFYTPMRPIAMALSPVASPSPAASMFSPDQFPYSWEMQSQTEGECSPPRGPIDAIDKALLALAEERP